jgi:ribonuclease P protein component
MRLAKRRQFDAVYRGGAKTAVGPLVAWAVPNDLGHWRLGLAVSRRVGTAPARNRLRRLLRESFRLLQHEMPAGPSGTGGYDVVVGAHPHEPLPLERYQGMLLEAMRRLERRWTNRSGNVDTGDPREPGE